MRGGPDEAALRERNKAHTPGFFLDAALEEASPEIRLDTDSRWQGGVEADEARRRAITDFACFTGTHRGAETLVAAVPVAGWAERASSAFEVAYAERLSRTRVGVDARQRQPRRGRRQKQRWQQQQQQSNPGEGNTGGGVGDEVGAAAEAGPPGGGGVTIPASGIMLRHVVPAKDVTVP